MALGLTRRPVGDVNLSCMGKVKMNDNRFVLLNDKDNILVCCSHILAGENVSLEGEVVTLEAEINVGHKVARRDISKAEKIIRYGAPIGSATVDISFGQHVHLHNMKSDYIPSHTRDRKVGVAK
ncbi:UxaA family hydrolase [Zhongshania borealis]